MEVEAKPMPSPPVSAKPALVAKASPETKDSAAAKLCVSRKYVLPPRPKPGRKPSAETPPNRRKAQNREAQRAFRERRALAIQELEDKLSDEAKRHAREQANLKATIDRLARENARLRVSSSPPAFSPSGPSPHSAQSPFSVMASPDPAMELLDKVLEQKLPVPPSPGNLSAAATPKSPGRQKPPASGLKLVNTDWTLPAVPLRKRQHSLETDFTLKFKGSRRRLSSAASITLAMPESPVSMENAQELPSPNEPQRKTSPPAGCCGGNANGGGCCGGAARKLVTSETPPSEFLRPDDRCGFCTDDTPCVCAATAARESSNMADIETLGDNALPPLKVKYAPPERQWSQFAYSPPEVKQEPDKEDDDPMATLFCSAIAAKAPSPLPAGGTFIPAQAAYRTLSRHRMFSQVDLSALVSSLDTRGVQVEVNSVARVLRSLDRK